MNRAVATLAKRVALAAGPQVRLFSVLGVFFSVGGFLSTVISLTKGGEGNEMTACREIRGCGYFNAIYTSYGLLACGLLGGGERSIHFYYL